MKRCAQGLQCNIEDQAHVADLGAGKVLENRNEVQEFVVVRVREPAADGNGVLRVENVRRGRVVDDDGVLEITTNLRQILVPVRRDTVHRKRMATYFYIVSLMVVTAFAEEAVVHHTVDVELIEKRVTVLSWSVSV